MNRPVLCPGLGRLEFQLKLMEWDRKVFNIIVKQLERQKRIRRSIDVYLNKGC